MRLKIINNLEIKHQTFLNNRIKKILIEGKNKKGVLKSQFYINLAVVFGFILFIIWVNFLYPETFIDIKLILALLFLPSLLLTVFLYKKLLRVCGYNSYIKNDPKYNIIITLAAYFLITVPIGNVIVSSFLFSNYFFAQSETQTVSIKPYNIGESNSRISHKNYTHIEVEWDGIKKRINVGNNPVNSIADKIVNVKISKGLLGYYIIRGYRFENQ
jgi:hypothetical protein